MHEGWRRPEFGERGLLKAAATLAFEEVHFHVAADGAPSDEAINEQLACRKRERWEVLESIERLAVTADFSRCMDLALGRRNRLEGGRCEHGATEEPDFRAVAPVSGPASTAPRNPRAADFARREQPPCAPSVAPGTRVQ